MAKRTFVVDFEGSIIIELDDNVIKVVDDEWRKQMFDIRTPEEIAQHVAFNMVANRLDLEQIDGWANLPNDRARIVEESGWVMTTREITKPKRGRKK